ncbi:MAG: glycogen debranching enzyme family protein [Myxococcales bacterium]|nr:glycogen debranching enzyme family protein [Myxococcales bacterium]MCB9582946.1 glycogen debranching enzyme family protein [Polyangiaceae bacterium]
MSRNGARDFKVGRGPWPVINVGGELERAEREWLHTNGAGAYAMSTLALMHTRREHGLLVAALDPPLGRTVVLSHAETSVSVGDRNYRLSTHQFPNVAPTPGYRLLAQFSQDPLPRWRYRLGKAWFERSLCLVRGRNAAVMRYQWHGFHPARLSVMPLMPLRRQDRLAREHGGIVQRVTLRPGQVEVRPVNELPPIVFAHAGMFMGSPDWWRRFEYVDDRGRYDDWQEDMWTPGTFELTMEPGATTYLLAAVGELPKEAPEALMQEAIDFLRAQDPGETHSGVVRTLSLAAASYRAENCGRAAVLAGYPWLGAPFRDWLISIDGLYLACGKIDEAKRTLATVLEHQHAGLLPEMLPEAGMPQARPCPDATLWLFHAAGKLASKVGANDPFVQAELYPALVRAFERLSQTDAEGVRATPHGLLVTEDERQPVTWMDARGSHGAVTPRNGVAVEHQALWAAGTEVLARLADALDDVATLERVRPASMQARSAFRARFWCNETEYPFDCISEVGDTADAWADPTIRPNAVLALAAAPELFDEWQARSIVTRAKDELLTPRGLRSLSPRDPRYEGVYAGTPGERDASYHQGTVWSFLLGAYVRASLKAHPSDMALREELRILLEEAVDGGPVLGHPAQLADGEHPHRLRGCPAQAWSVAELLSALVEDLVVS